jgi:hypothetical protein
MKTPILTIQKFTRSHRHGANPWRHRYFFRIKGANGEIIAQSESYTTARARNKTVALLVAGKMEVES